MIKTVITTGALAISVLVAILILTVIAGSSQDTEYVKFGLSLLMFLLIIIGSYWFVVRGPGGRM